MNNIKGIEKTLFGRGTFDQLGGVLEPIRNNNDGFVVFVVDNYFKGKPIEKRIPIKPQDDLIFIDVDPYEPKTEQIDNLRDEVLSKKGLPAVIVGIGGGSIMDIAKASALMFTNPGSSTLYQGLNLIKKPGIYNIGIPTIAGTGAECSMTAVVTGPEKKLGLKCEYTVFNQVILDPDLTTSVPVDQWFYTGMDCYIHCIESESGIKYNTYSKAYGDQALSLCREIFLGEKAGQTNDNNEKLMVASLFGGLSLTHSEVGVCHALSYGLSVVFGYKHGIANCIAFNVLEDYYPKGVKEFRAMVKKHNIKLPTDLSAKWSEEQITAMAEVSLKLEHMWNHAVGEDWKSKISLNSIFELFKRM